MLHLFCIYFAFDLFRISVVGRPRALHGRAGAGHERPRAKRRADPEAEPVAASG